MFVQKLHEVIEPGGRTRSLKSKSVTPATALHLTYKNPVGLTAVSYSAKSSTVLPQNRYFYEYQI